MGKLLDLMPRIEEGLFVDSVEKTVYEDNGWDLRPELEGKGSAKVIWLSARTEGKH